MSSKGTLKSEQRAESPEHFFSIKNVRSLNLETGRGFMGPLFLFTLHVPLDMCMPQTTQNLTENCLIISSMSDLLKTKYGG